METNNSTQPVFESIDDNTFIFNIKSSIITLDGSLTIGETYWVLIKDDIKYVLESCQMVLRDVISDGTLVNISFANQNKQKMFFQFNVRENQEENWWVLDSANYKEFKRLHAQTLA